MPITPGEDKMAFYERIRYDPYIIRQWQIADEADARKKIVLHRQFDDMLTRDTYCIAIFDIPSEEAGGPFERSGIQVDVIFPSAYQNRADATLSQVMALCGPDNEDGWAIVFDLGGVRYRKEIVKAVKVGDLASAPEFYRCGARFFYNSCTITNKRN